VNGKILIVDDEEGIRNSLGDYFDRQGFTTMLAEDGLQALEKVKERKPDIVILDVNLPLLDGLEVCKQIRQESGQAIGIIMISHVRKEMVDRVVGLELGADVYTPKPFETSELNAQVRALLRRMQSQKQVAQTGWFIVDDHLQINFDRRIVERDGREVHLTKLEFDLLKHLAERPGLPIGRSELIDNVWGYAAGEETLDAAVNTAINKLRSKIEPDPANPRYIHSVHGIGYRFSIKRT
jgi:two-component system, OmpR family, alkaline phosphatase synthesis response regulator PhoP